MGTPGTSSPQSLPKPLSNIGCGPQAKSNHTLLESCVLRACLALGFAWKENLGLSQAEVCVIVEEMGMASDVGDKLKGKIQVFRSVCLHHLSKY